MKLHPACKLFPAMNADELNRLKEDIRLNGVRVPVTIWQGWLIDGKNRIACCEQLGIECPVKEWEQQGRSVVSWVLSQNLHRRHLTASERAIIGQEAVALYEKEAKQKQVKGLGDDGSGGRGRKKPWMQNASKVSGREGRSTHKAAKAVGASERSIQRARAVAKADPELLEEVRAGKKGLDDAYRQVKGEKGDSKPPEDGRGVPVASEQLWDAFRDDRFRSLASAIQRLRNEIKGLAKEDIGHFLHLNSVDAHLQNVKESILFAAPYAPCPYHPPVKDGCTACKGLGWLPKTLYKQAPAELRKGDSK